MGRLFQIVEQSKTFLDFFLIPADGILVHSYQFVCQRLGFEDLYPLAARKKFGHEVGGEFQVQFEIGEIGGGTDFSLGGMQGQVAQIVGLVAIGAQDDTLDGSLVIDKNAETIAEEVGSIEVVGHLEFLVGKLYFFDAVEGEGGEVAVGESAQDIPPLAEQLDAIGRQRVVAFFRLAVAVVGEGYLAVLLHCLDDEL